MDPKTRVLSVDIEDALEVDAWFTTLRSDYKGRKQFISRVMVNLFKTLIYLATS